MKNLLLCLWIIPAIPALALNEKIENILERLSMREEIREAQQVVIADLDETLIDSTARKYYSVKHSLKTNCSANNTVDCQIAAGLNLSDYYALSNRYDLDSLFDKFRISRGEWRQKLIEQTTSTYLSGKFMNLDQPISGAVEFIRRLKNSGALVYFVSSRFNRPQRKGTIKSLKSLGMLNDEESNTVILREEGEKSIDFKRRAFLQIKNWAMLHESEVSLVLENEPENMNTMLDIFPEAEAVFVDGAFIKNEPLKKEILHISSYN